MIDDTLRRIRSQARYRPRDVCMTIGIPTQRWVYRLHELLPLLAKRWRPSDFASLLVDQITYGQYEQSIAPAVAADIQAIAQAGAEIRLNAAFADFESSLLARVHTVHFCVTHLVDARGVLEFSDGPVPVRAILDVIERAAVDRPVSVVFFVCESAALLDEMVKLRSNVQLESIGASMFRMPWPKTLSFARHWIEATAGGNTLHDSARVATQRFLHEGTR